MGPERAGWRMSSDEAVRVRRSSAVEIHDQGVQHFNRVVEDGKFGLVVDRRPKKQTLSLLQPPAIVPQRHPEHQVLRDLNEAGLPFVPKILYADHVGLILQYVPGEVPTTDQWNSDAALRKQYRPRLAQVAGALAGLTEIAAKWPIRPEERGFWPDRVENVAQLARLRTDLVKLHFDRVMRGWIRPLVEDIGGYQHVPEALAGIEVTGDRPLVLQHGDLHQSNTVREPFTVLDWANAGLDDPLRSVLPEPGLSRAENEEMLAAVRAVFPAAAFDGYEHDVKQLETLSRQTDITIAVGIIAQAANGSREAVLRAETPESRREAIRAGAEKVHLWSRKLTSRRPQWTVEETAVLLGEHIKRELGTTSSHPVSGRGPGPARDRGVEPADLNVGHVGRAPAKDLASRTKPPQKDLLPHLREVRNSPSQPADIEISTGPSPLSHTAPHSSNAANRPARRDESAKQLPYFIPRSARAGLSPLNARPHWATGQAMSGSAGSAPAPDIAKVVSAVARRLIRTREK